MFRTITARFKGKCCRCGECIEVGTRIRYGGPGRTYHIKADCPQTTDKQTEGVKDAEYVEQSDPRTEFGYDGRQMGYMPSEDIGDW